MFQQSASGLPWFQCWDARSPGWLATNVKMKIGHMFACWSVCTPKPTSTDVLLHPVERNRRLEASLNLQPPYSWFIRMHSKFHSISSTGASTVLFPMGRFVCPILYVLNWTVLSLSDGKKRMQPETLLELLVRPTHYNTKIFDCFLLSLLSSTSVCTYLSYYRACHAIRTIYAGGGSFTLEISWIRVIFQETRR